MPTLRCPRCGTMVQAEPGANVACPSCGFSAPSPAAPAPSRPVAPASPSPPPPMGAPMMSPVPAAPAGTGAGKTVEPWLVVVLAIVTLGVYGLFYWWRVSRETDVLRGARHAHGVTKVGIILAVCGGAVAVVTLIAIVAAAVAGGAIADNASSASQAQLAHDIFTAALPFLAILLLAFLVAVAGGILTLVGQYRSWDSLKRTEVALGRPDTVNPPLYLWLPLGLSLLGVIPFVGVLLRLAGAVLQVTFMAITQKHLNDLWARGVTGPPAPAPVAAP